MRRMRVYTEELFVYISKEQKEKLLKIADENLATISDIVRKIIDEYVKNYQFKDEEVKQ